MRRIHWRVICLFNIVVYLQIFYIIPHRKSWTIFFNPMVSSLPSATLIMVNQFHLAEHKVLNEHLRKNIVKVYKNR